MSTAYALEAFIVAMERARTFALAAGLGEHAISEIDHLANMAKANKGENQQ